MTTLTGEPELVIPAQEVHGERPDVPQAGHYRLVIESRGGWIPINWKELRDSRELLQFLIWRDVKVRYKQTVLGVGWALLQPLLSMLIFTAIFGRFVGISSDGLPYAVFVYAGLLPWTFFCQGVTHGGQSLVNQQHLLTKVYLPRLFVPAASVGGALLDLAVSFGLYVFILCYYEVAPGWGIILLPVVVVMTILAALGLSFLLAALTVTYRDFRYVVPFLMQMLMYLSPVVYPVSVVPARYQGLLAINPMAGIIDGYRATILGRPFNAVTFCVSASTTVLLFGAGLYYFRRVERRFADIA